MDEQNQNTAAQESTAAAQQTQQQAAQTQTEKLFTQAELDAAVSRRLARAQRGMPDEAELAAFRTWKESQQTEQQRLAAITQERDTAKNDLTAANAKTEQLSREILMYQKGITDAEDVKYYAYRIGQMVTDSKTFEQAAEEYFKDHPPRSAGARVDTGGSLSGGTPPKTNNDFMNALIRGAR